MPPRSLLRLASKPLSTSGTPARLLRQLSHSCRKASSPFYSSTPQPSSDSSSTQSPPYNRRWLSEIKQRLGKCIGFGCQGEEIELAGKIAGTIAREWRGLVAGAEGFCIEDVHEGGTGAKRRRERTAIEEKLNEDKEELGLARRLREGNAWVEGVRWGDMDSMGTSKSSLGSHVNNASYLRYAEISRVHYFRRLTRHIPSASSLSSHSPSLSPSSARTAWLQLCTPHSLGIIYSRASLSFLLPIKYPDRLTLCHRLADNPEFIHALENGEPVKMIPLDVVALSNRWQRNAVRVHEENVVFDYKEERRAHMSGWMLEVLRAARREEQEMKRVWGERRAVVEGWVGELEGLTVNSGKAEDMGD